MARPTRTEIRAEHRAQQDREDPEDREIIERTPNAAFQVIRMMIPLFEGLKKDISDLQKEVARLKIRTSQLEDA
jgi:hypothetical protein